jgi:hypothetical protein
MKAIAQASAADAHGRLMLAARSGLSRSAVSSRKCRSGCTPVVCGVLGFLRHSSISHQIHIKFKGIQIALEKKLEQKVRTLLTLPPTGGKSVQCRLRPPRLFCGWTKCPAPGHRAVVRTGVIAMRRAGVIAALGVLLALLGGVVTASPALAEGGDLKSSLP